MRKHDSERSYRIASHLKTSLRDSESSCVQRIRFDVGIGNGALVMSAHCLHVAPAVSTVAEHGMCDCAPWELTERLPEHRMKLGHFSCRAVLILRMPSVPCEWCDCRVVFLEGVGKPQVGFPDGFEVERVGRVPSNGRAEQPNSVSLLAM
jgi:hypothetical protein